MERQTQTERDREREVYIKRKNGGGDKQTGRNGRARQTDRMKERGGSMCLEGTGL